MLRTRRGSRPKPRYYTEIDPFLRDVLEYDEYSLPIERVREQRRDARAVRRIMGGVGGLAVATLATLYATHVIEPPDILTSFVETVLRVPGEGGGVGGHVLEATSGIIVTAPDNGVVVSVPT